MATWVHAQLRECRPTTHRIDTDDLTVKDLANEYTKVSVGLDPTDDYTYDVRGNLSRDDGFDDESSDDFFEYSYDPENRLTKVEYDDDATPPLTVVAKYRYDVRGRQIEFINSPLGGVTVEKVSG